MFGTNSPYKENTQLTFQIFLSLKNCRLAVSFEQFCTDYSGSELFGSSFYFMEVWQAE